MKREKPPKPYPDFPLYPHANGQWAKKIKGKTRFFGPWNDWRAALKEFEGGVEPTPDELNLDDLVNLFLAARKKDVAAEHIKSATWDEYRRVCAKAVAILGRSVLVEELRPAHFQALRDELTKTVASPVTLRNEIVKLRVLFAWAYETDHVDQPLRYRQALKRPPMRLIRDARNQRQKKLFTRKEIVTLIRHASGWMKPAIYLGINGGLGNRDLCEIEWSDIDGEWLRMAREKTAVNRRMWLWPETLKALKAWRKESPESKWICCGERGQQLGQGESNNTPIGHLFSATRKAAAIESGGRGFYTLRHTYRTIADEAKDRGAVRFTMGHADGSIDDAYIEEISDERLVAVSQVVRAWFKRNG